MDRNRIFSKLKKSKFRSSFFLDERDKKYIREKNLLTIEEHAKDFIDSRLKIKPKKDGKQTPWRGHPVFKAQHGTGTCCRKCIEKWHNIPREKELNEEEAEYIKNFLMQWIKGELLKN